MIFTERQIFLKSAATARWFVMVAALLAMASPAIGQTFTNGQYCTFTQGGWGAPPHGTNPGALLAADFSTVYPASVYPAGLIIGYTSQHTMTFASALVIQDYLPAGGKPKALTADYPTSTSSGVFGGQVLTLELNVDFGNAGLFPDPGIVGNLVLSNTGTSFDGQTVSDVLAVANQALGGGPLPADYTISSLNDLVTLLNQGFDNCLPSGWVQSHLSAPVSSPSCDPTVFECWPVP